ncbi:hypothetical protein HY374_04120 [Candidatus Berkelbacteria bacterium]|nr:hypothetical protein [Candidatus Berkelbacteria bacterium]
MHKIGSLVALGLVLLGSTPVTAQTTSGSTGSCEPAEIQPTPNFTRLGSLTISPDVAAVGEAMTFQVTLPSADASAVTISLPPGEVTDWAPQQLESGTAKPGNWTGTLPAGDYYATVTLEDSTKGAWQSVRYTVTGGQGLGEGSASYAAYLPDVPITLSAGSPDQRSAGSVAVPIVIAFPGATTATLATDLGRFERNGQRTIDLTGQGSATAFLILDSGQKATVTGSSPEACTPTTTAITVTQKGNVKATSGSGSATTMPWLWIGIGLLALITVGGLAWWLARRRSTPPAAPVAPAPVPTPAPPPAAPTAQSAPPPASAPAAPAPVQPPPPPPSPPVQP